MQQHRVRRLIVRREHDGAFQGIVVRSDCLAAPDHRQSVTRAMPEHTHTCGPNMPLGAVGMFMRHHRIGGLPVIDEHHHLCGIITESDVLKALAAVTTWDQAAEHILVQLSGWRDDLLPWLIQLSSGLDIAFVNILPHQTPQGHWQVSMRLRGKDIHHYLDLLRQAGSQILWKNELPGRSP
jgi:hypothetical protein